MSVALPVIVEDWKPVGKNTLLGFCRVRLPSGMILHDVAVHIEERQVLGNTSGQAAARARRAADDGSNDRQAAVDTDRCV